MAVIDKHTISENALIAIDSPLVVPNETGRRVAEELVGRGEVIAKMLELLGLEHSPYIQKNVHCSTRPSRTVRTNRGGRGSVDIKKC